MALSTVFLCGPLAHAPLLAAVLGRAVALAPAMLPGHALVWSPARGRVALVAGGPGVAGARAAVTAADLARLDHYAVAAGAAPAAVALDDGAPVRTWRAPPPADAAPFDPAGWAARHAAVAVAVAADIMALYGTRPAAALAARHQMMLVRAASRLRAAGPAPATIRRPCAPGDVHLLARRQPYANFFAVEEYDLRHRRFDGAMSPAINRAAFISGDAATVLPYDPVRDRVLVIEQFRPGPQARGDANPWLLEPVAGRIDPAETPEDAARREAAEEAGLTLGALIRIAAYYPSPAAKTEFLYSFVALADLPDDAAGRLGGMADEHEDIRAHLLPFERLMQVAATPEGANGPLILSAFWLAANRDRLRAAGAGGELLEFPPGPA
ncbi:NUDIX domain-containing protein [Ruixingdingia sedimenti]|uniref:ADP-ribose pyrophosphatase n=1 Tax=Ruixingdingia sedimenti TaxID=3073604 RepID=A0ABU1FEB5_9RHOB|nr:NUDIX domain-containing protein [Xinfangfangia sp. LG-4]MDR5655199.1 NUDIX domain-containing protein [Xinfangfangia sp. LG-4]